MNISQITNYLFIGAEPKAESAAELHRRNVRLVISMIGARRPPEVFAQPPYRLLWLRTFDTFLTPVPISKLISGVETALPIIEAGHGVFTFCAQGRHRSVAMASAILIAMGHPAEEAMRLVQSHREVADPEAWHIRRQILIFERRWRDRGQKPDGWRRQLYDVYCESMADLISKAVFQLGLDKGLLAGRL